MWYWHGMGIWGWIVMLAFGALMILLIVWIARPSGSAAPPQRDALGILDERFAKGEIDSKEYEERRAVLKANK